MSHNSTVHNFFAVPEDLVAVLQAVESRHSLKYVECGLFDQAERSVFYGFSSLPNLGIATAGDYNLEPTFLILPAEAAFKVRAVPQKRGGTKYAVDQMENTGTVVLKPGGKYGESTVIAGMVGSVHHDDETENLLGAFSRALNEDFTRVKSYIVGPGARKLLDSGVRLTKNVKSPREFDLAS